MGVEQGVASVVLSDAQGTARVKVEVGKDGRTRVEGLAPAPSTK